MLQHGNLNIPKVTKAQAPKGLALFAVQMQPAGVNRAQFRGLQDQVRILAMNIGLRSAARAMGLNEERIRQWSSRGKWGISNLPIVRVPGSVAAAVSPNVTPGHEAVANIVQHYGDRAKIGATIAGAKALEHLADCDGAKLVTPAAAISGDQWTKAVDRAAGWTAARQSPVQVAVQVNVPAPEADAERRARHAKLDEIASLLRERSV